MALLIEPGKEERPTGLVLAPFGGPWGSVDQAVRDALDTEGVNLVWVNAGAELDAPVAATIHEYLDHADFIVADLTDANPNVMYEMGYAHAQRTPVLPVVERRMERVPPVLRGRLFFVYEQGKPKELIEFIGRWAGRYIARKREVQPVG